jgi:hypothetical protein
MAGIQRKGGAMEEDRSALFAQIVVHLDFVASMDEEDHGGSAQAGYIREVLIPFCEQEGGLKTNEEQWEEYLARKSQ